MLSPQHISFFYLFYPNTVQRKFQYGIEKSFSRIILPKCLNPYLFYAKMKGKKIFQEKMPLPEGEIPQRRRSFSLSKGFFH